MTNGEITAGANHTVTNTNANPATGSDITQYTVYFKEDTTPSNDGVLNISATVAGMTYSFPPIDIDDSVPAPATYTVSGDVTGAAFIGGTLDLLNNGGDAQPIAVTGDAFTFSAQLDGDAYAVTVTNNNTTLTCVVTGGDAADGSGTIAAADVINIVVDCN